MVQGDGQHQKASELLEGLELTGGWRVLHRIPRVPGATGSNFSTPYLVERDDPVEGRTVAFLKALDFTAATGMAMPIADALQLLTRAYVFERDVALECQGKKMKNVIVGIDAGQVHVSDPSVNPFLADVPYIIFERADEGDLRRQLVEKLNTLDEAWIYRVCHGAANGLRQLHQAGITHQDVKPSNVLSVGTVPKLGDLGRASLRDGTGIYDGILFAGDPTYAPPECLYQYPKTDHWDTTRQTDMYQLGSLLVFLFTGSGLTGLLHRRLPPAFHWSRWPNDYQNALPFVRNAFDEICVDIDDLLPAARRKDVLHLVRILCEPDPALRGWPGFSGGSARLSMERCVSYFNRLARMAEIDLRHPIS